MKMMMSKQQREAYCTRIKAAVDRLSEQVCSDRTADIFTAKLDGIACAVDELYFMRDILVDGGLPEIYLLRRWLKDEKDIILDWISPYTDPKQPGQSYAAFRAVRRRDS